MGKADYEYLIFCQCSTEDKNNASLQVRTSLWNQGKSYSVLSDFPWSRAFLLNCIIFYLNVRIWLSAAGVGWWPRVFTACRDQVKAVSSATNRIWLNLETKGHCKKIDNNNTDNTTKRVVSLSRYSEFKSKHPNLLILNLFNKSRGQTMKWIQMYINVNAHRFWTHWKTVWFDASVPDGWWWRSESSFH